jgi:hypothetical protein
MTLDIRAAGSSFLVRSYEWEQPKSRLFARLLGRSEERRQVERIDEITCPFPFAIVPGADAEASLDALVQKKSDGVPIILGTPESAADMVHLPEEVPLDELLAELNQFDPNRWFSERLIELELEPPRGTWPTDPDEQRSELYTVRRPGLKGDDFEPEVVIAIVPVAEPALVALHLGYGSWNDCPYPIVHAAMARRWSASNGAVPVVFARDVVEYRVTRPIATREQALAIALEQFAYSPDIVLQGTETIEKLASDLIGKKHWFFWWD